MSDDEFESKAANVKAATDAYSNLSFGNFDAKWQAEHEQFVSKYGQNYDKPSGEQFGVNIAEAAVINEWVQSLREEILSIQKSNGGISDAITGGEPYYGATGGGLSYTFLPTGLGTILTVKETITGKTLNVTDALNWHFYG